MSTSDPGVTQLNTRISALIRGANEEFNELCCSLFRFQYERCEAYRAFCERRGVQSVDHWHEIPAVPTDAFKHLDLLTFRKNDAVAKFHTSGTTDGEHGCHYFNSLDLYRQASMRAFGAAMMPEGHRMPVLSLIPTAAHTPDSSLSQMVSWVIEDYCDGNAIVDPSGGALQSIAEPTLILGTAFALADAFENSGFLELPIGTRIMETGGFKGRRRVITRTELHALYQKAGIASKWVIGEYGMTELSSQWYDGIAGHADPNPEQRVYWPAPWARTRVIDPVTMSDVSVGETGLLLHIDPVNMGSVQAVLTSDLGQRVSHPQHQRDGFKYIGRASGAAVRGCSLRSET